MADQNRGCLRLPEPVSSSRKECGEPGCPSESASISSVCRWRRQIVGGSSWLALCEVKAGLEAREHERIWVVTAVQHESLQHGPCFDVSTQRGQGLHSSDPDLEPHQ